MERASFGQRLERARLERGWTQEYVAGSIGVEPVTVGRWERGLHKPSAILRHALCSLFEMTKWDLGLGDDIEQSTERDEEQQARPSMPEQNPVDDASTAFRKTDLTERLESLVWTWLLRKPTGARYQELQAMISLEAENNKMKEDLLSRRDALRRLASLPLRVCGLSLVTPVLARPVEEILATCAAGITACWHLRKGKDLVFVSDTLAWYLPTLKEIARIGSTTQRKESADLLAQCLTLQSELAMHNSSNSAAISYAQEATQYGHFSENPILHLLAWRRLAAAYFYADRWEQAVQAAEKAKFLLLEAQKAQPILPVVQSYIYAGLATYQAHTGLQQDALTSLGKAHTTFFAQSSEPIPIWISNHSEANLVLNDGLSHLSLGKNREAFDSFQQITKYYIDTEIIRVEATINQVLAEVHSDGQRDMDICISLWEEGMHGAKLLHSEQWFNEARLAYAAMRAAWPGEQKIKALREQIVHW
ncbi:helix-turn-helix domain-containing protein [Ktedonosporobacter rubrisoli]|nr:helix-turn-helix domain-containing protein [Ktedonosporobacter rubrisoli]